MRGQDVENPMVVDSRWNDYITNDTSGYSDGDRFVSDDDMLDFAVDAIHEEYDRERLLEDLSDLIYEDKEVRKKFLDWFYKDWERVH